MREESDDEASTFMRKMRGGVGRNERDVSECDEVALVCQAA